MLIKVCGLCQAEQVQALAEAGVDFLGFIFYTQSPRYCGNKTAIASKGTSKRVGVFVNEPIKSLIQKAADWSLDYIQLHGEETSDYALELQQHGLKVIKAFGIEKLTDFEQLAPYEKVVNAFLFDTKSSTRGGSGKSFDWSLLNAYQGEQPYFLSGGIGPDAVDKILSLAAEDKRLWAIDINSRFEHSAGDKDIEAIIHFIKTLKKNT
jgi:phosphoribosylanthranilate isomerase